MPARLGLNAGTFARPLALLRVVPKVTNASFARVGALTPARRLVFTGRPLTTGATGVPGGTVTTGALDTLVDSGALTTGVCALAFSDADSCTKPAGAFAIGEALADAVAVGVGVGTAVGVAEANGVGVGVGAGVGVGVGVPPLGTTVYVKSPVLVTICPSLFVTTTFAAPAVPAGVVAVIDVDDITVAPVACHKG